MHIKKFVVLFLVLFVAGKFFLCCNLIMGIYRSYHGLNQGLSHVVDFYSFCVSVIVLMCLNFCCS